MEIERRTPAAYLPFQTFITSLDHLANITIPNIIDNRTFPAMSHQSSSQVVSAFKFFDLIDDSNSPKPLLSDLAHKKDERKNLVRQLIEAHYSDIAALDFAKMSSTQLDNALAGKKYNVGGETRKKARTFLLKAAQFAGFTVHPLLTKITRNRAKGVPKRAGAVIDNHNIADTNGYDAPSPETVAHRRHKSHGSEKTVQLKSGAGSVTLSLDVDLLELDEGEDRDFVLGLADKFRAYEKGLKVSTDEKDKVEKEAGE